MILSVSAQKIITIIQEALEQFRELTGNKTLQLIPVENPRR